VSFDYLIGAVEEWKLSSASPTIVPNLSPEQVRQKPQFEEKYWDVIGLYLDPPAKALVLCCDEKNPMPSARTHAAWASARTHTHDDAQQRLNDPVAFLKLMLEIP
jgi:hypothetical protein